MNNYLTINGVSSLNFGVYITDAGIYNTPQKDIEAISIPGRSGDLLRDNHRYKNVDVRYPAFIVEDFNQKYTDFISFLLAQDQYFRLEDTYRPEEYRLAYFTGGQTPNVYKRDTGAFDLIFHCKPQRFLHSGETVIPLTTNGVILNPTYMSAKPLVRVYGTGAVTFGEIQITIQSVNEYVDIDCYSQMAYKGAVNCNGNIVLNSGKFFELKVGENNIQLGSGISRIEITPRWYRL